MVRLVVKTDYLVEIRRTLKVSTYNIQAIIIAPFSTECLILRARALIPGCVASPQPRVIIFTICSVAMCDDGTQYEESDIVFVLLS